MASLEMQHYSHKVGVNVHHIEWCTKYRYRMLRQDKYKNYCENTIRKQADRHEIKTNILRMTLPKHKETPLRARRRGVASRSEQPFRAGRRSSRMNTSTIFFRSTSPEHSQSLNQSNIRKIYKYITFANSLKMETIPLQVRLKRELHRKLAQAQDLIVKEVEMNVGI